MTTQSRIDRARAKSKRNRTTRRWRVPSNIGDHTVVFALDDEIHAAHLQLRWQPSRAIAFGRRTLEVAIEDACEYESYHPGKWLAYWARTADLAARAHRSLNNLTKHIGPAGIPPSDVLVPRERVSSNLTKSGKISLGLLPRGQPSDQAKVDLNALLAAREALAGFVDRAQKRRKSLASRRKNEGDLGKRAFVYRLAEGWIFLTGKRPGRSFNPSRNPFLRFVIAAWTDAGLDSEGEDFSRALDAVLKGLAAYEGWPWSAESRQTVAGLIAHGPVWM